MTLGLQHGSFSKVYPRESKPTPSLSQGTVGCTPNLNEPLWEILIEWVFMSEQISKNPIRERHKPDSHG